MSPYWQNVLENSGVNGLAAYSLSIAIRSGQLSGGQAGFAGVGAYIAASLAVTNHQGFAVCLIVGFAVSGILGMIARLVFIRLTHLLFAIATLAFGEIATIVMGNVDQKRFGGPAGLGGIPIDATLWIVGGFVLGAIVFELFVLKPTAFDLRGRLVHDDDLLVSVGGHSPAINKTLLFGLSTGIAGIAGVLSTHVIGFLEPPNLQYTRSFDWLVYAVVGGAYSGVGALFGGILMTISPEIVPYAHDNRALFEGIVLLSVMILRPQGIFTRRPVPVLERLLGRGRARDEASKDAADAPPASEAVGLKT